LSHNLIEEYQIALRKDPAEGAYGSGFYSYGRKIIEAPPRGRPRGIRP